MNIEDLLTPEGLEVIYFNCRIKRRDIGYLGIKKQREYAKAYLKPNES